MLMGSVSTNISQGREPCRASIHGPLDTNRLTLAASYNASRTLTSMEAAGQIRRAAPHAYPNRRMIALADGLLQCEGRLVEAREAMGPPRLTFAGPLVELPLLR